MKRFAGTFLIFLHHMLEHGTKIRFKTVAGHTDPTQLEWYKPDEISLKCWRATCKKLNILDCEEIIANEIANGGFVERSDVDGRTKWLLSRMIHHGLLDSDYCPTQLGKDAWKEWNDDLRRSPQHISKTL